MRYSAAEAAFAALEGQWADLLRASDANPLFMSCHWLSTWWPLFGAPVGRLRLYEARDVAGNLRGVAPCWLVTEWLKRAIPVRRMQLVGTRWRAAGVALTEYCDFVVDRLEHRDIVSALLERMAADGGWDELVISLLRRDSPTLGALEALAAQRGWMVRKADPTAAYRVSLEEGFGAYLARRSPSVRRRLFGKRKKLEGRALERRSARTPEEVGQAFRVLDAFHLQRWAKPAFAGARLDFHERVCAQALQGGRLELETAFLDGRPFSVAYDLRDATCEYNIQSGFEPASANGLSPGLLHLGWRMEAAANDGIPWLDLLAGRGRATDYKNELADDRIALLTVQVVRSRWLAELYRLWDRNSQRQEEIA